MTFFTCLPEHQVGHSSGELSLPGPRQTPSHAPTRGEFIFFNFYHRNSRWFGRDQQSLIVPVLLVAFLPGLMTWVFPLGFPALTGSMGLLLF